MPYADVNGMRMYYEQHGRPEGAPLVLLNGGGGTIDDPTSGWAGLLENNRVNPSWTIDDLHRIVCPALLIAGENDPFANIDQMTTMKREIAGAEWLIVNHAGHPVHFEHPAIVGPRILDFLRRADAPAPA